MNAGVAELVDALDLGSSESSTLRDYNVLLLHFLD